MDTITLYHGSEYQIKEPKLNLGKKNNDFGQGFYLSPDLELAKEWAVKRDIDGFVNSYTVDLTNLNVLDLTKVNEPILSWISILLRFRSFNKSEIEQQLAKFLISKYSIDLSQYDVIIGYRADDSYFSYAQRFLDNRIPLRVLEKALLLGELGIQYCLRSQKAFSALKYQECIAVSKEDYYIKFLNRDLNARFSFVKMEKSFTPEDLFAIDILRKNQ